MSETETYRERVLDTVTVAVDVDGEHYATLSGTYPASALRVVADELDRRTAAAPEIMPTDRVHTEVMRIVRAGLAGDTERLRSYVAHWHHNLAIAGDLRSAERLRRELAGETPSGRVVLDDTPTPAHPAAPDPSP